MQKIQKTLTFLLLIVVMLSSMSLISASASNVQLEGAGTKDNPWLISDAEDFAALDSLFKSDASYADDYYQMTNDIDFTGVAMASIGKTNHFKGVLDGQNYEIKNLTLTDTTRYTGLFSYIEGGTIKNLGIVSSTITGGRDFGAFSGYAYHAVFLNCYSKAVVTGTRGGGGFTGGAADTQFLNCFSTANVTATDRGVGGITGSVESPSSFDNVYSAATVQGTTTYIGIVAGYDQEGKDGKDAAPVTMNNVYYYGDLNASGNYPAREVIKLTEAELTDGTLLGYLNNGLQDDYKQWITGDDKYPTFNLFQVALSGAGTEESPYIIESADDLIEMSRIVNYSAVYADAHYKMTANIDLLGSAFNGIASVNTFTGTFDGAGHVLKNIGIDNGAAEKVGLFYTTDGAVIKNLGIENGTIEGGKYVGGFIGSAKNTTILNCFNGATVIAYGDVGGLIGTFSNSSILNSFNKGMVRLEGKSAIGGLAGSANATTIKNSYNIGRVNVGTDAGNLIGWSRDNLIFENTYYNKEAAIKNQPIGTFQNFGGIVGMTKEEMLTESFVDTLNANLEDGYSAWEYGEDKLARLSVFEETAKIDAFMASIETVAIANGKVQEMISSDGTYKTALYGSDNRNVIDLEGNVYQPLTSQKVLLILDIVSVETGEVVGRLDRNIEVVVEGKYANAGKNEVPNVVPGLREWYGLEGCFTVTENTKIAVESAEMNEMSVRIQTYMKDMFGLELDIIQGSGSDGDIVLRYAPERIADLKEEGYAIEIDQQIIIEAPTETGMLYGVVSIMQIMQQDETHSNIPKGYVRDYPQYDIRGGMIHAGANFYPLDYIEEIGKYMSWYKLNTIEVNITANRGEFGGSFVVESKKYPALNEGVGECVWSQDDYRQMQKNLQKFGVDVVTLFNSPGHATPFRAFASDIMSGNDFNLADHYDESLALIKDVYDEFLDGDDPVFQNAIVHIGTDESTNSNEDMRKWISDLSQYLLTKDTVEKVAYWGNLNVYYGETEIDPENLIAQLWDYPDFRADEALAEGFEIINSNSNLLYICLFNSEPLQKGTYFCGYADIATFYDTWKGASDFDTRNLTNPYNFDKGNYYAEFDVLKGDPKILGSIFCEWDRYGNVNDYNVLELLVPFIAGVSEKCWYGDTDRFASGEEFAEAFDQVGNAAAYANPRYRVESENSIVAAYTFDEILAGKVSDRGENGYDATIKNGKIENENGSNVLVLDGITSIELPFKGIGYPYTVNFDIYLNGTQNQDAILFKCDHGTFYLDYEGKGVSFETNRYVHSFNVAIPTDEWVEVKITSQAPTYAGASTNTTVLTINGIDYKPINITDSGEQTKATVLGTEEMFTGVDGYIDNLTICNSYNYDPVFDLYKFEGEGTEEVPYLIQSATDLQMFSYFANAGLLTDASFKMTADIDMSDVEYHSVTEFKGTLDGDGHKITNLTISEPDAERIGLVAYLNGGTIKNLGIEDSVISGYKNVGALAGEVINSVIMNCYSKATVSGVRAVGGIAGSLNSSQMYNCYSMAVVSASLKGAGGIAGALNTSPNPNNPAALENVYSAANVSGTDSLIGSITGYIEGVSDSFSVYMTNVYYYDEALNACGNRTDIEEDKLSEVDMTDGTLLNVLNANLTDGFESWGEDADAYPCFSYQIDISALEAGFEKAVKIDTTNCTLESEAALVKAIKAAEEALNSNSQKQMNEALRRLDDAVAGLEEVVFEIITQPTDTKAAKGVEVTVFVEATGRGLTYTWYYKNPGNVKFYASGDEFVSEDGATYTISMYAWRDGQEVYCVVTDETGASIQSNTVKLTLDTGSIVIEKQPESMEAASGEEAVATVSAAGEGLTYQWYYKNPGNVKFYLSGKDFYEDGTYSIPMAKWRDGQEVYCVITDANGDSVQTETVTLTMVK